MPKGSWTRWVACGTLVAFLGCATIQAPAADGPCRDSLGRFASCGGGGGSDDALIALGVVAGLAAIVGAVYLVAAARPPAPPDPPVTAALPATPACALPVPSVQVCQSSRGYRFAHPDLGTCPAGSTIVAIIALQCADLAHPAYHACLDAAGAWFPARSWESCGARGLTDAPGDFVPPGRRPEQGLAPDAGTAAPPQTPGTSPPSGSPPLFRICEDRRGHTERVPYAEDCVSQGLRPAVDPGDAAPATTIPAPTPPVELPDSPAVPVGAAMTSTGSGGPVYVHGYYRRNGTYVAPYTRSSPGSGGGRRR